MTQNADPAGTAAGTTMYDLYREALADGFRLVQSHVDATKPDAPKP